MNRHRVLLLAGLVGNIVAAVAFFAVGMVLPGLLATAAGLATLVAAGRRARPTRWPPEDRADESR